MTRKSHELLKAQIYEFADSVEDFSELQRVLLKYSNELSRVVNDPDELQGIATEEEITLLKKYWSAYVRFIYSLDRNDRNKVYEYIQVYDKRYKNIVANLRAKILEADDITAVKGYLGRGNSGVAFKLHLEEEGWVVIKFTNSLPQNMYEIRPMLITEGIDYVPRLITYSFEDGVKVMTLLPGKPVIKLDVDFDYPEEHIEQLIHRVLYLHESGIVIDPKPDNIMYDESEGFSILDIAILDWDMPIYDYVPNLIQIISARNFPPYDRRNQNQVSIVSRMRMLSELRNSIKLIRILKQKYPEMLEAYFEQHEALSKVEHISAPPLVDYQYAMGFVNEDITSLLAVLYEIDPRVFGDTVK